MFNSMKVKKILFLMKEKFIFFAFLTRAWGLVDSVKLLSCMWLVPCSNRKSQCCFQPRKFAKKGDYVLRFICVYSLSLNQAWVHFSVLNLVYLCCSLEKLHYLCRDGHSLLWISDSSHTNKFRCVKQVSMTINN